LANLGPCPNGYASVCMMRHCVLYEGTASHTQIHTPMSPPIVFLQQGAPAALTHLNCALLQARWWNPGREIMVIGDAECRVALVVAGVEFVAIEDFGSSAAELRKVYVHLSANSPEFELFCLERWFVLRDFLRQRQLESVWHFDSDVMVFEDLSSEDARIAGVDFTFTQISGHNAYFRINALDQFCSFILKCYLAEPKTQWLHASHAARLAAGNPDTISDMFFIEEFKKLDGLRSLDFSVPESGQSAFDTNIRFSNGYEMDGDLKQITFTEQQPYALDIETQQLQRFATLHFQYFAKQQMPRFLRPPGPLPDWSLGALTQLLTRMQTMPPPRSEDVRSQEQKNSRKGSTTPSLQPVIKNLRSILDSRWLRVGGALKFTRAARKLEDSLDMLRKMMPGSSEQK